MSNVGQAIQSIVDAHGQDCGNFGRLAAGGFSGTQGETMDYPINAEAARQLIEMVDRDVVRAELARRMGWTACSGGWIAPDDRILPDPPDPFTNAADNRALVAFLAADGDRWFVFIRSLIKLLPKPERSEIRDATFRDLVHELSLFMIAPLEDITIAAAQALGIQEASE